MLLMKSLGLVKKSQSEVHFNWSKVFNTLIKLFHAKLTKSWCSLSGRTRKYLRDKKLNTKQISKVLPIGEETVVADIEKWEIVALKCHLLKHYNFLVDVSRILDLLLKRFLNLLNVTNIIQSQCVQYKLNISAPKYKNE